MSFLPRRLRSRPPAPRAARAALCTALLLAAPVFTAHAASSPTADVPAADDRIDADALQWRGLRASVVVQPDGSARLRTPGGEQRIAAAPMRSETASPLFDALFALAQNEIEAAKVEAITDWGFNDNRPLPCPCFETGEKWRYVWTRDLSFAADLALARLEPERTRTSLRFKLSEPRVAAAPPGLYVAQDTGSGGSWPVSTDRVVWFLAARHLIDGDDADAKAFDEQTWRALTATLAQDRLHAFDDARGLYRGETSFLDWREQTYPAWTANEVTFIAQSFALSTNVLHHQALRLAERMARARGDARAGTYAAQADALAKAIDARFWREDRGRYMSYVGTAQHPVDIEAYDLLGIALAIDAGIAPPARARRALANYPTLPSGSPVIWPQQPGIPIYHNRAIWPFVSAYALRAARRVDAPARIAHELRSLLRGAALSGSNMENFELTTQAVQFDDTAPDGRSLSGPVVNSRRQLWSVAGFAAMVIEGVYGLEADGRVAPKLPAELVPLLFAERREITLQLRDRRITLRRPADDALAAAGPDALLVAGRTIRAGRDVRVELKPVATTAAAIATHADAFAPASPDAPAFTRADAGWRVDVADDQRLYVDGARRGAGANAIADDGAQHCASLTRVDAAGLESLPGPTACVGPSTSVEGDWPRRWTAPAAGTYRAQLRYDNRNGPINTGVTAAVKRLHVDCDGQPPQAGTLVMPHSVGEQASTTVAFTAPAGAACAFRLDDGFNMSYLRHFADYTGGKGGRTGPLNSATLGALIVAPAPKDSSR
uniref:Six-hairpin glycosidase-like protein n=1 Tax=Cognatilysobacter tabacisoli TaxID=2315424 RepID=UPI001E483F99|nr:Six-hairpin glycosidase-like protein [Lysobacter tabacisoli]